MSSQSFNVILEEEQGALAKKLREEEQWNDDEEDYQLQNPIRQAAEKVQDFITVFSYKDIEDATDGLTESNKIGQGAFGRVYKGWHGDVEVAIKVLDTESWQGIDGFIRELEVLGHIGHQNIVKVIGACFQVSSLVYEYLPRGSLEDCLNHRQCLLTWQRRFRIVFQICSALMFLHSNKPHPLVHGDPKPSNILLDENFNAKLSDFGISHFLSKGSANDTFTVTNNVKGTEWYIDPDYVDTGTVRPSCDVYSFGVTILRILTGRPAAGLIRQVRRAIKSESMMEMVDSAAGGWPEDVAMLLAWVGVQCCSPRRRNSSELMAEFCEDLKQMLADIGERQQHQPEGETPKSSIKSRIQEYGSTSRIEGLNDGMPRLTLFSFEDIEEATNGFSESGKIGQGGYGTVYKGKFGNSEAAIKVLGPRSMQGVHEFFREVAVLGHVHHENIVQLKGVCFQLRSVVYEYLPNGSIEDLLRNRPMLLTWQTRVRIVFEICSALAFLHSNKPQPVIHGDPKPHNILIGANFNAKLTDFGLSHFLPGGSASEAFIITKNVAGTEWYIDPDFLETGIVGPGCDVHTLGVTVLRILTGQSPARLLKKVERAIENESLMTIVDFTAGHWPKDVAMLLANFGLSCCEPDRNNWEIMENILTQLKLILDDIEEQQQEDAEDSIDFHFQDKKEVLETSSEVQESESTAEEQATCATLNIKLFSKYDIKAAIGDLSDSSVIGEGGCGRVYRGYLHNTEVAIKVLKAYDHFCKKGNVLESTGNSQGKGGYSQGKEGKMLEPSSRRHKEEKKLEPNNPRGIDEFLQELESLGGINHDRVVNLIGVCFSLRCLVYEYIPNGSLEDWLKKKPELLPWQKRTRMVYEICLSLMFLRSSRPHHLVHGDIKPGNILLDVNLFPKLSDFGFCHLLPGGSTDKTVAWSANVGGTEWYMHPEFLVTGNLTFACDVYSFGVTILRILTRKNPKYLVSKVYNRIEKNSLMEIVDPKAGQWPEDVAGVLANLALNCCDEERDNSGILTEISTCLKDILDGIGE